MSVMQLQFYGHVARFKDIDPAHRIASERDNLEWRRLRGWPQNSWLKNVDIYCRELLGVGQVAAWRLARRDLRAWRRRVSAATAPRM